MFVVFAGLNAASVLAPSLLGSYRGNLLFMQRPSLGPEQFQTALIAVALSLDVQILYGCNYEWRRVSRHEEPFLKASGRIFYGALALGAAVSMAVLISAL